jgi:uncharacterized membrane protein
MQREGILAPLLVIAAALRIAINNVVEFSRADETIYLLYTRALAAGEGYTKIVSMFLGDPGLWVFPNPLRWSYLGATRVACAMFGECSHHTLSTVSTIAGIVSVGLTYWIARELFDVRVGLAAAALMATSPLQLALGRRALADEFFSMLVLASVAALIVCTRDRRAATWQYAVWVVATTLTIAAKEQFLFVYPVMLLFWWLRTRTLTWRELLLWALPPFLFFAMFCALAGDGTSFFRIAHIITSVMTAPYAEQYQSGPAHRLVLDSLAVAPIVTLLAMAALAIVAMRPSTVSTAMRHLAIVLAAFLAIHAMLPSQNLRYIVPADALLRILVPAFVLAEVRESRWSAKVMVSAVLVNSAVELLLFWCIFMTAEVYDPVTDNLLRALHMLPR